jgi:hypothetical protein
VYICSGNKRIDYETLQNTLAAADDNGGRPENEMLGMKSGGGSCCVLYNPSADGFGYRYSTHRARLNNLKGQNIDAGIEPDYQLEPDEFFDIEKVGKLIEQFYAK